MSVVKEDAVVVSKDGRDCHVRLRGKDYLGKISEIGQCISARAPVFSIIFYSTLLQEQNKRWKLSNNDQEKKKRKKAKNDGEKQKKNAKKSECVYKHF